MYCTVLYCTVLYCTVIYLAEVDNAAEEVEESLKGLEGLKEVDEGVRGQLFVVLGRNLHTNLINTIQKDCQTYKSSSDGGRLESSSLFRVSIFARET